MKTRLSTWLCPRRIHTQSGRALTHLRTGTNTHVRTDVRRKIYRKLCGKQHSLLSVKANILPHGAEYSTETRPFDIPPSPTDIAIEITSNCPIKSHSIEENGHYPLEPQPAQTILRNSVYKTRWRSRNSPWSRASYGYWEQKTYLYPSRESWRIQLIFLTANTHKQQNSKQYTQYRFRFAIR